MIQVNELLVACRSRLGDIEPKKYRWSDEELIDYINMSISSISIELQPFTHTHFFYVKKNEDRYILPHNFTRILSITLDDKPLNIVGYEYFVQNKININELSASFDEQSVFLYPIARFKENQKIEISYKYIEEVSTKEDKIKLSTAAKKALLFHTLHLAYQINTSERNIGKTAQYLSLYQEEMIRIKPTFYTHKHSKKIRNKFKRI